MPPLYVAIHAFLIAGAAGCAARLAWRSRTRARLVLLGVVLLGALQAIAVLRPRALALIGWPDVFFFAELHLELSAALLASVLLAVDGGRARLRAALLGLVLAGASGVRMAQVYRPSPVQGVGYAEDGVVAQTQPGSCAAAAAATLLRCRDIEPAATETELARLCFTHARNGTHDLGLYRGLSLAARKPVHFEARTLDSLGASAPCIGFVGLERERAGPEFESLLRQYQWNPGEYHAIVIFGMIPATPAAPSPYVLVGDPSYGLERWPLVHFIALWDGSTLEIER